MPVTSQTPDERFVQEFTGCQARLYAYIAMLVGDTTAASDVLQETNLVIWRKASEYVEGTDFAAWACAIARFQVLAHLRDTGRDRHLFDETLIAQLAGEAESFAEQIDARHNALRNCLQKLTAHQRALVKARYTQGESIQQVAADLGRTSGSIKKALSRIRQQLFECIQKFLAAEGST